MSITSLVNRRRKSKKQKVLGAVTVLNRDEKVPLRFVQAGTENAAVIGEFLSDLIARGVRTEQGLLVFIDGGKGLRKRYGVCWVIKRLFSDACGIRERTWCSISPRTNRERFDDIFNTPVNAPRTMRQNPHYREFFLTCKTGISQQPGALKRDLRRR